MDKLSDELKDHLLVVLKQFTPEEINLAMLVRAPLSKETRIKISKANRGNKSKTGLIESEETRRKHSEYKSSYWANRTPEQMEEWSKTNSKAQTGKTLSKETREKIGEANKGRTDSEETTKRRSKAQRDFWASLPLKEKEERLNGGLFNTEATVSRANHNGTGYLLAQTSLFLLLEEYFPDSWIHNGGQLNSVWIAGLEPDFIHKQEKKIIEFFETWAHKDPEEESKKRQRYQQADYRLLVIREEDLWIDGIEFAVKK